MNTRGTRRRMGLPPSTLHTCTRRRESQTEGRRRARRAVVEERGRGRPGLGRFAARLDAVAGRELAPVVLGVALRALVALCPPGVIQTELVLELLHLRVGLVALLLVLDKLPLKPRRLRLLASHELALRVG